ncbi:pyruvate dehydrogenase E2 component [Mycoplasmopsis californica]|uniref:Dihydrolipoyl dehydrogenase n=1 Tax=Mycoplasmopsis equigenitalium TaxID=114883 RepID=A0ABY5J3X6_9BACT|nr:dihydrolipoyl dehydrogenase [Mycoplasmopsis equigenitalium]UUD37226.1 dihydrolipoyl dehydrogenase [Mycoplasmopsis equigenitalium]VEU69468.1 pyruvate dehydrogenase E2 component [Mycoplasmopsis californica]
MYKFKFADIGEGLHEGVVGDIYVKEGQKVNEGDSLFSVETDKVTSDIPSPVTGTVKQILMKKGDTIHVGQEIFLIDDGSKGNESAAPQAQPSVSSTGGGSSFYEFKFADIGEGLHEGVVAEIYKKENDKVNEGDSLFSVETDKVTSDIPSPVSGTIKKVLMNKGDTIHVGQVIYHIDDGKKHENAAVTKSQTAGESGGASVVGEVKVSDELFDLSVLSAPAKKFVQSAPVANEVNPQETDSYVGEPGKAYTGAVEKEYDVIVVGSGPGGYLAAEESGKQGLKTLIIEKEHWGGVCLNVGCIPTKELLKSSEVIDYINHAPEYGIAGNFKDLKIDADKTWKGMHSKKKAVVDKISASVKNLMKMSKCDIIEGEATFVGSHEVKVNGKVYRAKNLIIATGSVNRLLNLKGFDKGYKTGKIITSRQAINYDKKLPKSLTIIGGGVIGVEFAQVYATAGTKVTILQNADRLLPTLDAEIVKVLEQSLIERKVKILYNVDTKEFNEKTSELIYEIDGKKQKIKSDVILTSIGRVPVSLGLAEAGFKLGSRGELIVDEHQKTNVAGVYGIGDVTNQNMLAHVAYKHALVAVDNILGRKNVKTSLKATPGCIYTHPEIATVGLTEQEAKKQGYKAFSSKYAFEYLGKGLAAHATQGFIKLVVDEEFGEVLGCHIIGAHATDFISEIALAIELEATVFELTNTIHPHPTFAEIIWEAARSAALKLHLKHKK